MICTISGAEVTAGFRLRRAASSGRIAPRKLAQRLTSGSEMHTTTPTLNETMRQQTPTTSTKTPSTRPQSAPTTDSLATTQPAGLECTSISLPASARMTEETACVRVRVRARGRGRVRVGVGV